MSTDEAKRKARNLRLIRKRREDPEYRDKERLYEWKRLGIDITTINRPRPSNCEVCGTAAFLCCDHSHATGKFRGWLCRQCNSAIGLVKDNPLVLRRLAEYVDQHG
jgi:hypothetical protein